MKEHQFRIICRQCEDDGPKDLQAECVDDGLGNYSVKVRIQCENCGTKDRLL